MQVSLPNGDVITYAVDGRGRRVGKSINGMRVKGWLYADQLRPIAELDGDGNVVSRFVYGTKVNVPEYMIRGGVTYRIFSDHLGSPRVIVDASTGAIVQRMDFQAFGEIIQDSNPGWQPFGFAGGLYDPDTGLIRFGARDYDSQVGRWTAKDPIGFQGADPNLYRYASGDSINGIDSTGLACTTFWERFRTNFEATNRELPGLLAPTGLGFVLRAGKTFAEAYGTTTLGRWAMSGFGGAVLRGVSFTALETGVLATATQALAFIGTAAAFEVGVAVGSMIDAAVVR